MCQKIISKMCPVGGHSVNRSYCPQRHSELVCAFVTHHPHTFYRKQDGTCLPNRSIKFMIFQCLCKNLISFLKQVHPFGIYLPQDANGEAGSGKWMSLNQ